MSVWKATYPDNRMTPADRGSRGVTLMELLVALAVTIILLVMIVPQFATQVKQGVINYKGTQMRGDVRAGFDLLSRDIRMAGYNPREMTYTGIPYKTDSLKLLSDLNGDSSLTGTDEVLRYYFNATEKTLYRQSGADTARPLIDNVLSFSYQFLDSGSTQITTAANEAKIRQVSISMTGQSTTGGNQNMATKMGAKTYTLSSVIRARNLGIR